MNKGKNKKSNSYLDPKLVKARKIRSSLLGRVRYKYPELIDSTPTADKIYKWIKRWDGKCFYFKTNISLDKCHVDHKTPINREGTNKLTNLCITHPRANVVKGNMDSKEFKQFLRMVSKWEDRGKDIMDRLSRSTTVYRRKNNGG